MGRGIPANDGEGVLWRKGWGADRPDGGRDERRRVARGTRRGYGLIGCATVRRPADAADRAETVRIIPNPNDDVGVAMPRWCRLNRRAGGKTFLPDFLGHISIEMAAPSEAKHQTDHSDSLSPGAHPARLYNTAQRRHCMHPSRKITSNDALRNASTCRTATPNAVAAF